MSESAATIPYSRGLVRSFVTFRHLHRTAADVSLVWLMKMRIYFCGAYFSFPLQRGGPAEIGESGVSGFPFRGRGKSLLLDAVIFPGIYSRGRGSESREGEGAKVFSSVARKANRNNIRWKERKKRGEESGKSLPGCCISPALFFFSSSAKVFLLPPFHLLWHLQTKKRKNGEGGGRAPLT